MAFSPSTPISSPSGASSCKPSSQVFHRGTALPPFSVITAMAASSSMDWIPPSDSSTAAEMAPAILVMVRPWSASPKRESISVSSCSADTTEMQACFSRLANSRLFIVSPPSILAQCRHPRSRPLCFAIFKSYHAWLRRSTFHVTFSTFDRFSLLPLCKRRKNKLSLEVFSSKESYIRYFSFQ